MACLFWQAISIQIFNEYESMMTIIGFLNGIVSTIDRILAPINKYLGTLAFIFVGLMVIPIVADVSMRLILHRSILGIIELQEFGLVLVVFFGLSQIESKGLNIRIDLFVKRYPKRIQNIVNNINYLLASVLFLIASWHTVLTAIKKLHERSDVFGVPISIFIGVAAMGLFLLSGTVVKKFLSSTVEVINDRKTPFLFISLIVGLALAFLPFYVKYLSLGMGGLGLGMLAILFLMVLLLVFGMPLAISMLLIGYIGLFIAGKNSLAVFGMLGAVPYYQTANYIIVVLPMFMMMGSLAYYSAISGDLFNAAQKWLGWIPGGLAVSSIAGCAGFAAVCGDSMATAVTMGTVAYPAMKKNGYDASIATGCLAAGGTLGILIPPSIGFIIYAILTEESVSKLFVGGMVPGIVLSLLFTSCIFILAKLRPHMFPPGARYPLKERLYSLKGVWAVIVLFVLILGGILGGIFSPNEGGAIGAFGAFVIAVLRRRLTFKDFIKSLQETASITGRMLFIFIGVGMIGYFLAATRFPSLLAEFLLGIGAAKYLVLLSVCILYIILGCLVNVIPMIMLTLPAIFPSIVAFGFDPIWFGVLIVILMEMGQITPPVGINVFTISAVSGVSMETAFKGILPFLLCMAVCLLLLTIFPQLALFLVNIFF